MSNFKSSLLLATAIAGVTASSAASAQTYPAPFAIQAYEADATVVNVAQAPAAPLSLADNPFAIQAPGNPATYVITTNGTTAPTSTPDIYGNPQYAAGAGYTVFDGDYSIHGVGSTAVQNVLVRTMNCFGTPNPLANGQAVAGGSGPTGGSLNVGSKTILANTYAGTPSLTCNNGTFAAYAPGSQPANAIQYSAYTTYSGGVANNSKSLYFIPGSNITELQPQFSDYSVTTGNLAAYGFSGKYVGSGSGLGQKAWEYASDVFDDGYGKTTSQPGSTSNVPNPFVSVAGQNAWSHVQYAFSDAPIVQSNLTLYNANASTKAGPAVEFPLFVVPVAIVYNTVYASTPTKTMTFNAKGKAVYAGSTTAVASLQLTGSLYCGIFNGMITNWNDAALTQANKNIPLFDPINDNAARWGNAGAPIRLVGRMDNSGTTDIFTRHLAAVCSQDKIYGSGATSTNNYYSVPGISAPLLPVADKRNFVGNKYLHNAQTLPYSATTGLNYTSIRSDTHIDGSAYSAGNDAGTVNTISGDYWTGSAIGNIGTTTNGGTAVAPATPTKTNGSGLFIVANGGSAVAATINYAPDYDATTGTYNNTSATDSNILYNGKVGYISADVVTGSDAVGTPATGFLRAAVLATLPNSYTATGGIYAYTFYAPTVKNALSAFNTQGGTLAFLPPESDASGNYVPSSSSATSASGGQIVRSNPFAWTDQFYQNGTPYGTGLLSGTYSLAQPSQGFPIVGTTQMLTYTCFVSPGNRQAIADLVATLTSALTVDSTNTKINKNAFTSPSPALPGIIASSSIGIVPAAWQVAVARTFLQGTSDVNQSTTGGGTANAGYAASPLNFTSAVVPTKVKVSAGVFTYTPTTPNQKCAEGGNGSGSLVGL
ncbi:substrate-binding domain-containing protein [Novosphingobium sp.]|uniref:substrate-binding domain-containing protein n=1 Tax=Novosphingobium sp. TaxID=1874826 RepID=UPI003D152BA0